MSKEQEITAACELLSKQFLNVKSMQFLNEPSGATLSIHMKNGATVLLGLDNDILCFAPKGYDPLSIEAPKNFVDLFCDLGNGYHAEGAPPDYVSHLD